MARRQKHATAKRTPLAGGAKAREAARLARRLVRSVKDDIVRLLQRLVRTESVAVPPKGNEAPAQRLLAAFLKEYGVTARLYDTGFLARSKHRLVRRERNYSGRPNLVATLRGTGGGKSILFSGHMDTVPAPGEWKESPFSGSIRRARLHGRGAWDMKGGLAAHFGVLLALKKAGMKLRGDVLAESVVDEEWAGGGGTLAARLSGITADACIITECTGLDIVRASRGGFFLDIIARAGDPSSYFSKEEVVSPALPVGRLLGWVDDWRKRRREIDRRETYRDFPDPAPVQVLAIEANRFEPDVPWSTPLEAKVKVYFQFLPYENVESVIRKIRRSFDAFCRRDPFFKRFPPEWRPIVWPPLVGHELPAGHPLTKTLAGAATAALGRPAVVTASEWPCDAFICQKEFGIPTVLFGPKGAGAHNVNEYVDLRSVIKTAETLLATAILWCA